MLKKLFSNIKNLTHYKKLYSLNFSSFSDNKDTKKDNKQQNKQQNQKQQKQGEQKQANTSVQNKENKTKDISKSKENAKPEKSFANEKYNIVHHYDTTSISSEKKKLLENIVTQFLREEKLSSEEAEKFKKDIRDPLYETVIPDVKKLDSPTAIVNVLKDVPTLEWYYRSMKPFMKLLRYQREERDLKDPNYIQVRSQDKLLRYKDMKFMRPKNTDVRQNVNSPDFLKVQPKLQMNYSYNLEEHKEFTWAYEKAVVENTQKEQFKQKLIKYIKTYPNRPEVKFSLMKKHVVVPLDSLPDYDVDISDFKPPISKKSRRKYDKPKNEVDIKDYNCWRSFDRLQLIFTPKQSYLTVELIPKHVVEVIYY
jgi:hypothetical protein